MSPQMSGQFLWITPTARPLTVRAWAMAKDTSAHDFLCRTFTSGEAAAVGLDPQRLRLLDFQRLSRGIYAPRSEEVGLAQRAKTHLDMTPEAWVSHRSAAAIQRLWIPSWLDNHELLHLSKPAHLPRVRRQGVVGHRVRIRPGEIHDLDGLLITSPGRTWLDLGAELTPAALVALGDQLIRRPRPEFEDGRVEPYETQHSLAEMLAAHPKMKGVARCREALADMRVGSDSPAETALRLALMAHGFPEPVLQYRLNPRDPASPIADQAYVRHRIALQYDGEHHREPDQQLSDRRRDAAFVRQDWAVVIATAEDLRDDFLHVRRELRILLATRAA